MKLMVIGGGGREHAIIKKLKENPAVEKIYCLPGNGGIAADAVCVPEIGAKDIPAQVEFAKVHRIDYAVVAPDDPLALGAVDALTEAGVPCFGPDKKAAVIEASKAFSKDLMKKYGIPTAKYELFTDADAACAYIDSQGAPIVVKADGLALGKGVVVAQTVEEAKAAVRSMIEDKAFGQSGARVVIEEFMEGPEVSVLSFYRRRKPLFPWCLPWTTSARWTATRARTPAAWARSPQIPATRKRSRTSACRRSSCPRSAR